MTITLPADAPPYHYIAYIDEAGDPGLARVRPRDVDGASEWLVIGAILIQAAREHEPVQWVRKILDDVSLQQRDILHYKDLSDWRKPMACKGLAENPLRIFALASNKKNMRGHTNPRAAAKGNILTQRQYFYNFCLRLILERITDYCYRHSVRVYREPRRVLVVFSNTGGHSHSHVFAYSEILKNQSRSSTTFLKKREIRWEVVDRRLLAAAPTQTLAGLQLADVVASSVYQAVDILPPTVWNPGNAKLLRPRVAREGGLYRDYGFALLPTPPSRAELLPKQKEIFEFYGYNNL
jgi:hypothetical protein